MALNWLKNLWFYKFKIIVTFILLVGCYLSRSVKALDTHVMTLAPEHTETEFNTNAPLKTRDVQSVVDFFKRGLKSLIPKKGQTSCLRNGSVLNMQSTFSVISWDYSCSLISFFYPSIPLSCLVDECSK